MENGISRLGRECGMTEPRKEVAIITVTLFLDKDNREYWKIESNKNFPPDILIKVFKGLAKNLENKDPKHYHEETIRLQ